MTVSAVLFCLLVFKKQQKQCCSGVLIPACHLPYRTWQPFWGLLCAMWCLSQSSLGALKQKRGGAKVLTSVCVLTVCFSQIKDRMPQFTDCFADKGKNMASLQPKEQSKCQVQEHSGLWFVFTHTGASPFPNKKNGFSQYFESHEALLYLILQENT